MTIERGPWVGVGVGMRAGGDTSHSEIRIKLINSNGQINRPKFEL